MFTRLRTKLTVLYAGLFAFGLTLISLAVYGAISENVGRGVRSDLEASATVFDRVWAVRSQQLQDGAALLSRDFGFREAVATNDEATIRSALENLRVRLGIDRAFIIGVDGTLTASDGDAAGIPAADVLEALDTGDEAGAGVFMSGDTPYQSISAPIMTPVLVGWVVFATRLDQREMAALEKLSAIPLQAVVLDRRSKGRWSAAGAPPDAAVSELVEASLSSPNPGPRELKTSGDRFIALVKPLKSMSEGRPVVLLLRFPLAAALAPYQPLFATLILSGLVGIALLVVGSWTLARSVTRPISALDDAVRRLQEGDSASVVVETADEIGRLADSFNTMAAEIRERERKITHQALHDPETDLPNRLALERDVAALIGANAGPMIIVAAIGVDRFTHVRGAIGYELSAALIRKIGARLAERHPRRVARLSTDVVGLAFEASDLTEARRMIAAMQADLEAPVQLGDNTIDVSVTAGLAVHGLHAKGVSPLIERANIALDQARASKLKAAVFDELDYGDPASNLSLMSEMRRAIAYGELMIHHQPKLDLRLGKVTGVEALVRWRHPVRGLLPPDLFVGMAEETGHIRELTDWVLAKAIDEQAALIMAGHDVTMSVNMSGRLLGDHDFAGYALDMTRKAKGKMCFEITETAVIDNPDVALQVIDRYSAAGVGVSIDDYGSGLSSLAYLKQIKADELKIDKAFILTMDQSQRDALLVRSTIDLAHSLGMQVTAEGVETGTALSLLTGMGCDIAQGFFIARPMPLKELMAFLSEDTALEMLAG